MQRTNRNRGSVHHTYALQVDLEPRINSMYLLQNASTQQINFRVDPELGYE